MYQASDYECLETTCNSDALVDDASNLVGNLLSGLGLDLRKDIKKSMADIDYAKQQLRQLGIEITSLATAQQTQDAVVAYAWQTHKRWFDCWNKSSTT